MALLLPTWKGAFLLPFLAGLLLVSVSANKSGDLPCAGELLVSPASSTGTTSEKSYSGIVELTVSGVVHSRSNESTDAFYSVPLGQALSSQYHQLNFGVLPKFPMMSGEVHNIDNFIVWIDGLGTVNTQPARPAYDKATHTYRFRIDITRYDGGKLVFGVSDPRHDDNSGAFTICLTQVPACQDGLLSPGEKGIDCGGDCAPCSCTDASGSHRSHSSWRDGCSHCSCLDGVVECQPATCSLVPPPTYKSLCHADYSVATVGQAVGTCSGGLNGPAVTWRDRESSRSGAGCYTVERVFSQDDACVSTQASQIIHVYDDIKPSLLFAPNNNLECDSSVAVDKIGSPPTASDNCHPAPPLALVKVSRVSELVIMKTWVVKDDCGNEATANEEIHLLDTLPPKVTPPPDMHLQCSVQPEPARTGHAFTSDQCSVAPYLTYSDEIQMGTCASEHTLVRTWTAKDGGGNVETAVQRIHVVDRVAPELTVPKDVILECGKPTTPDSTGEATATDDCGAARVEYNDTISYASDCGLNYVIHRKWIATDSCGNEVSRVQQITVLDTQHPTLEPVSSLFVECSDRLVPERTGQPRVEDMCDLTPTVNFVDEVRNGSCPQEKTITRMWNAADDCENRGWLSQTIEVVDRTPPVLKVPADIVVRCDQGWEPEITGFATAVDNCDEAPIIDHTDKVKPGRCGSERTIERVWRATDSCGRESTGIQIITVVDDQPPTLVVPPPVTLDCGSSISPDLTGEASVTDLCDKKPTLSFVDAPKEGRCPSEKTIIRTWLAKDACGHQVQAKQVLTVQDRTPPVLVIPKDATVSCSADLSVAATGGMATATDLCDSTPKVTFLEAVDTGRCLQEKKITRRWSAVDSCGNVATGTQTVSIEDKEPPVWQETPSSSECLWPANRQFHRWSNLKQASANSTFLPGAKDACSAQLSLRVTACRSSQSEDSLGEAFLEDCLYSENEDELFIRAEVAGGVKEGRRYTVEGELSDECGNSTPVKKTVVVGRLGNTQCAVANLKEAPALAFGRAGAAGLQRVSQQAALQPYNPEDD